MRLALLFLLGWSFVASVGDGAGLDPHGGAAPVSADNGCGIDPNGRCVSTFNTGEGNGLDSIRTGEAIRAAS